MSHFNGNGNWIGNLNLKCCGTLLVFLEILQWIAFNGDGLIIYRPKVQEIIKFEYFLSVKIQ